MSARSCPTTTRSPWAAPASTPPSRNWSAPSSRAPAGSSANLTTGEAGDRPQARSLDKDGGSGHHPSMTGGSGTYRGGGHGRTLARLTVLLFALRALLPIGFMPDLGLLKQGGFQIVLCTQIGKASCRASVGPYV